MAAELKALSAEGYYYSMADFLFNQNLNFI